MDKCSCYSCTLELSSRERFYEFIFFRQKSYLREDFGDTPIDSMIIISTYFHSEGDIFFYCFSREELEVLEYHTDLSPIGKEFLARKLIYVSFVNIMYCSCLWM